MSLRQHVTKGQGDLYPCLIVFLSFTGQPLEKKMTLIEKIKYLVCKRNNIQFSNYITNLYYFLFGILIVI